MASILRMGGEGCFGSPSLHTGCFALPRGALTAVGLIPKVTPKFRSPQDMKLPLFALLCLVLPALLPAAGVAVYKDREFHSNTTAEAFAFESVTRSVVATHFKLIDAPYPRSISNDHFVDLIQVPSKIPDQLIAPHEVDWIERSVARLQAFATKYPTAKPLLQGHIDALQNCQQRLADGWVRHNRQWIRRDEYEQISQAKVEQQKESYREQKVTELENMREKHAGTRELEKWVEEEKELRELESHELGPRLDEIIRIRTIRQPHFYREQELDGGALIRIVAKGYYGHHERHAYLVTDEAASLEQHKPNTLPLFYSGTYESVNEDEEPRPLRAYALDPRAAKARFLKHLNPGD